jgi:hypothetical protein
MKLSIFSLFLAFFSFPGTTKAPQYRECADLTMAQIVHSSPVLIYGTLSNCKLDRKNLWINATLTIKTVIKGYSFDKIKTMPIVYPAYINNEVTQIRKPTYRNGTTYIFPMYKLNDTAWTTEINYCRFANLFSINPTTDKITFETGEIIAMADFATSATLFNDNYQAFLEAKTNNTPINSDSISNNPAFKFLVNDFLKVKKPLKPKKAIGKSNNK